MVRGIVLSNYPRRIALGTVAAATAAVLTSTNIAGPGSTAKRRPLLVFIALWVCRQRVYVYDVYIPSRVFTLCPLLLLLHPLPTTAQ